MSTVEPATPLEETALVPETALRRAREFILRIPPYPGRYEGRGIVTCAGGPKYFTSAWVLLRLLRRYGCTLPVQLWYLGDEELPPALRELVRPLGVECVDGLALRRTHPARILRGWELKPYAILHSRFREVLYLDADNVPVRDPSFLFETSAYARTGVIFWPDQGRLGPDREIWELCGVPYRDEPEIESGQMVLDKARCWPALSLTLWYNEHSDFFYRYVHGDKETFHLAFRKLEVPYAMPGTPMIARDGVFFQHDFDEQVLFQHRTGRKWTLDGANPPVPGFAWEAECLGYLDELRSRLDGGAPPRPPLTPDEVEERLLRTAFSYRPGRGERRPMTFKEGGRIGMGAGDYETGWRLLTRHGLVELELFAERGVACRLELDPLSGEWAGRWFQGGEEEAVLQAVSPRQWVGSAEPAGYDEFMARVICHAEPLSQNAGGANPGFGALYHAFVRNYRPDYVVGIGSARGFMPLCAARALQENGRGHLFFIDPSYRGGGDPGWDGRGHWDDAVEVRKWFAAFGLDAWITHLKLTSAEAFPVVRERIGDGRLSVVIVDGAHTYANALQDFELYSSLMRSGFVLFHDSVNPNCAVAPMLEDLRTRGHPFVTLDLDAGLSILQVRRPPRVDDKWSYLRRPSNRGRQILGHLAPLLRPRDRVFDAYCGFSPLAGLLQDVEIFGFDIDPHAIAELRAEFPRHRWEQIEERHLPYGDLPETCDVLISLGLNYGYCSWDAQMAEPNLELLVRYYRPRVCCFEAAAEYHDAEILDGLARILERRSYDLRTVWIDTDLSEYARRRILLGARREG